MLSRSPATLHGDLVANNVADSTPRDAFRILELGSGTGLVGLLASQVARYHLPDRISVCVDLTDYHEKVLENLEYNLAANPVPAPVITTTGGTKAIMTQAARALDWLLVTEHLQQLRSSPSSPSPLQQPQFWWMAHRESYDVVLAADVIYSPDHPEWLLACIDYFLSSHASSASIDDGRNRNAGSAAAARAHVLCPIRLHGRFGEWDLIAIADEVFSRRRNVTNATEIAADQGCILVERRQDAKIKGIGREDESGYIHWIFERRI